MNAKRLKVPTREQIQRVIDQFTATHIRRPLDHRVTLFEPPACLKCRTPASGQLADWLDWRLPVGAALQMLASRPRPTVSLDRAAAEGFGLWLDLGAPPPPNLREIDERHLAHLGDGVFNVPAIIAPLPNLTGVGVNDESLEEPPEVRWRLADGAHRLTKAFRAGLETYEAYALTFFEAYVITRRGTGLAQFDDWLTYLADYGSFDHCSDFELALMFPGSLPHAVARRRQAITGQTADF